MSFCCKSLSVSSALGRRLLVIMTEPFEFLGVCGVAKGAAVAFIVEDDDNDDLVMSSVR